MMMMPLIVLAETKNSSKAIYLSPIFPFALVGWNYTLKVVVYYGST
jgi:hypothetical protein